MQYACDRIKLLGNRIAYYRRLRGYSRRESAARVGISPRTLAAYERGDSEMSALTMLALSELYDVPLKLFIS